MLRVILLVIIGLVAVAGFAFIGDTLDRRSIQKASIKSIDFSRLPNGVYDGGYKRGRFSSKVRVTVASGRVTTIDVVQDMQYQSEVTQKAVGAVLEAQSLQVDTVSGATITTRAFLKAVENALAK
jgi:uncharacterized protein with FMN-binding domain